VLAGLDRDQERVERRDVDAHPVVPGLERLDEGRPGAGERVEHTSPGPDVPLEERLDQLGHELAEIRVQPVDVLRALALGQIPLRPREREVELAVELCLGPGHHVDFAAAGRSPATTDWDCERVAFDQVKLVVKLLATLEIPPLCEAVVREC
jgi:hypothetical protein